MSDFTTETYFYSNACHVCRVYGNKVQLKRCSGCKTIAYCSREHQSKHWQQHKDLCKLLTSIVKQAGSAFGMKNKRESSMESWTRAKTNLMLLIQMKLGRKLLPYETEMFKFPRSCIVCHETDSQRLIDCSNCPSTSFCLDHKENNGHKCNTLKLCFEIETARISFSHPMQRIVENYNFQRGRIPKSMQDAIDLYYNSKDNNDTMKSKIEAAYLSEYLTRPLTFLHAIKVLNIAKNPLTTIHVIGANAIEKESLMYWETLLHYNESLAELRIILVGPELRQQSHRLDLCAYCNANNARINVETVEMLYIDYAASKTFKEADFIIGFNLGIHEFDEQSSTNDTWGSSLKALTKQDCPFVMTSYTLQESQEEKKRLGAISDNRAKFCYSGKNPFASLRPYRDFESEDFFYQNNYVTIYRKLN